MFYLDHCIPLLATPEQGVVEEEEDLVITLEGISTTSLAHLTGRFYRWLGKKLPLGADVRAIQVWTRAEGAGRLARPVWESRNRGSHGTCFMHVRPRQPRRVRGW